MNGEFECEIWSDRLQYGAEVRGCFGPASTKRLKFLGFIADSLGKNRRAGGEDEGGLAVISIVSDIQTAELGL
jgi:hypothetical protein